MSRLDHLRSELQVRLHRLREEAPSSPAAASELRQVQRGLDALDEPDAMQTSGVDALVRGDPASGRRLLRIDHARRVLHRTNR